MLLLLATQLKRISILHRIPNSMLQTHRSLKVVFHARGQGLGTGNTNVHAGDIRPSVPLIILQQSVMRHKCPWEPAQ
jgi:hypothetical protein